MAPKEVHAPQLPSSISKMMVIESMNALACAALDGSVYLIDLNANRVYKELKGHRNGVLFLAYSIDYRYLASAGIDHTIRVGPIYFFVRQSTNYIICSYGIPL